MLWIGVYLHEGGVWHIYKLMWLVNHTCNPRGVPNFDSGSSGSLGGASTNEEKKKQKISCFEDRGLGNEYSALLLD